MIINLSPAQLGLIVASLELEGTEYASERDVNSLIQEIKDHVYECIGPDLYEMWRWEFDIID